MEEKTDKEMIEDRMKLLMTRENQLNHLASEAFKTYFYEKLKTGEYDQLISNTLVDSITNLLDISNNSHGSFKSAFRSELKELVNTHLSEIIHDPKITDLVLFNVRKYVYYKFNGPNTRKKVKI